LGQPPIQSAQPLNAAPPGISTPSSGQTVPVNPGVMAQMSLAQAPLTPLLQPNDQTTDDNTIAMVLERCLNFTVDVTDFDRNAKQAVQDFVVASMGQCKWEMHTETDMEEVLDDMGNVLTDEEGQPILKEVITSQE